MAKYATYDRSGMVEYDQILAVARKKAKKKRSSLDLVKGNVYHQFEDYRMF